MIVVRAKSIDDAVNYLNDGFVPMAGCTNIMVREKLQGGTAKRYVDITGIDELGSISISESETTIGALVTFADIEKTFKGINSSLYNMAYFMGGPQIRNRATVGGNICDASPACDSGPVLLAHDALLHIAGASGKRTACISDFFIAPGKTALGRNEMLEAITIPSDGKSFFRKAGQRNAMTVSSVSIAGRMSEGKILLAAGACAPTPVRLHACEEYLTGVHEFEKKTLEECIKRDICPIDARNASKEYRYRVCADMLSDALEKEFGYGKI